MSNDDLRAFVESRLPLVKHAMEMAHGQHLGRWERHRQGSSNYSMQQAFFYQAEWYVDQAPLVSMAAAAYAKKRWGDAADRIWDLRRPDLAKLEGLRISESGLIYEHVFTGGMFREALTNLWPDRLTTNNVVALLAGNFRTAWITRDENKLLPKSKRGSNLADALAAYAAARVIFAEAPKSLATVVHDEPRSPATTPDAEANAALPDNCTLLGAQHTSEQHTSLADAPTTGSFRVPRDLRRQSLERNPLNGVDAVTEQEPQPVPQGGPQMDHNLVTELLRDMLFNGEQPMNIVDAGTHVEGVHPAIRFVPRDWSTDDNHAPDMGNGQTYIYCEVKTHNARPCLEIGLRDRRQLGNQPLYDKLELAAEDRMTTGLWRVPVVGQANHQWPKYFRDPLLQTRRQAFLDAFEADGTTHEQAVAEYSSRLNDAIRAAILDTPFQHASQTVSDILRNN